jgi:hypothetical protein
MKSFLNRFARIAFIPLSILVIYNGLGLFLIQREFPYPAEGAAVYLKYDTAQRGTKLIVGCSNLKHNINPNQLWLTHPEADIFYSPAVANSTYMHFIGSLPPFNEYDTIIYYAPYNYIKKSIAIREGDKIGEYLTCGEYALQTVKNHPINFFNNWLYSYYSIKKQRKKASTNLVFYNNIDTYMNRIRKEPHYAEGKLPFNRQKHNIQPVEFNDDDAKHMEGIFPNKNVYLVFTPIPNIAENTSFIGQCNSSSKQFKNRFNEPETLDSTLFYDQWYHMNGLGSKQETERMAKYLSTLQVR